MFKIIMNFSNKIIHNKNEQTEDKLAKKLFLDILDMNFT